MYEVKWETSEENGAKRFYIIMLYCFFSYAIAVLPR